MSLQPIPILSFDQNGGLKTNKKPVFIPEQAFQTLENGYVYRDRVRKRQGLELVGRLQRSVTALAQTSTTGAGTYTDTDLLNSVRGSQPNAQIVPGTITFRIDPGGGNETIYEDTNGDGVIFHISGPYTISQGHVNYVTGELNLTFIVVPGVLTTNVDLAYSPSLPVMGIWQREQAALNFEQTIFFDTIYAYIWSGTQFDEFIPGTTWSGTNADFFWATNYRGGNAFDRLFFATNFVSNAGNPMRYTDGSTWTTFAPLITATDTLFQARILIPYYGRLLALNTYEGTTAGGAASAANFFNRCRFSQIGSPIAADAWRSDIFGRGGFLDAPTNEAIVGAAFLINTLIVFFERTTWQLRYVGEYGLPFVWERIDSDLGSESTFSAVLFNDGILAVGDKALIVANGTNVKRIDLDIPDKIFEFQNANDGVKRVQGVRDYQRELVFWSYVDSLQSSVPGTQATYPNKVLVYNYRNNTWADFRDNVTAFGLFQLDTAGVSWSSTDVFWDDSDVYWDEGDSQSRFPFVVSGNQQGFIHKYGYVFLDEPSLSITAIAEVGGLLNLTVPSHNLSVGETIRISGLMFIDDVTFLPVTTDLNDKLYYVLNVVDANTITLGKWDFQLQQYVNNFTYLPDLVDSIYIGGGQLAYFPKPIIQTKDFNPYMKTGGQAKLSYIDFLMGATPSVTPVSITGASKSAQCVITSPSHGLQSGQKINIYGVSGMTQLNVGQFYNVTVIDQNTFSINVNSTGFGTYTSGGFWILLTSNVFIKILINSSTSITGNGLVGNRFLNTHATSPFYPTDPVQGGGAISDYLWFRFFAVCTGQFFNVTLTYDDNLMNTPFTHTLDLELNAFTLYTRPGSKTVF